MGTLKKAIPILLFMVFVITACTSYEDLAKERAKRAKKATGDIRIALVWQEKLDKTFFSRVPNLRLMRSTGAEGSREGKYKQLGIVMNLPA